MVELVGVMVVVVVVVMMVFPLSAINQAIVICSFWHVPFLFSSDEECLPCLFETCTRANPSNRCIHYAAFFFMTSQPTSTAIKEGDTVLYKPKAEGEKEGRAKVVKVHPDSEGAHYTILPEGKDAKEKNTTGQRISKVCIYPLTFTSPQQLVRVSSLLIEFGPFVR